jgi:hypothetical protein
MGNFSVYGYVTDDWKLKPNLTLNLGLRYEMNAPTYDSKNALSRYNPAKGLIELGEGVPNPTDPALIPLVDTTGSKFRYLYNWDNNNFAPRLGLAWQPFHKDNIVVKGGYGVFYNGPIQFNQYISAMTQVPVRTPQTFTVGSVTPGSTALSLATAFTGGAGFYTAFGVEPSQRTPYIQEWSTGVQNQLSPTIVAEITYLGSKGTKLANNQNINTVPLSVPYALRGQTTRPNAKFGNVTYALNSNSSTFHSLQTSVRKNLRNGTSFLFAYTWGKSIDFAGGTGSSSNSSGSYQDPRNVAADRGLSDFDIRHRIVFSPVVELPFGKNKLFLNHGISSAIFGGFQISGIFAYQTGRPFTVTSSNNNRSRTFGAGDRPNLVANPNAGPRTVSQWFNTAAFVEPAAGLFGNAGRNIVTGPSNLQVDLTIARQIPIHERVAAQIRIESFNLPNHGNFFNPFGSAAQTGTSTFGQITNTYDPRQLQAAVRILF